MLPGASLNLLVFVLLPCLAVAGTGGEAGDCMEGWVDGRSVGLGCLLADQTTQQLNYPQAEAACKAALSTPCRGSGSLRHQERWGPGTERIYEGRVQ